MPNLAIAALFIGCIPSTFFYGQLVFFLTQKSKELSLAKWGILPWSVVIATNIIYSASGYVLAQELSQKPSNRNHTNAPIAWNLLTAGCFLSSVFCRYIPYAMLPSGSSKEEKQRALFNGNVLFATIFTISGLAAKHLFCVIHKP
ncbi:MAG TPA: hypothetical protein VLG44_00015 [Chlamydiales bacterium]|nr:hypothetical protein [Chlamydiales bacterium]